MSGYYKITFLRPRLNEFSETTLGLKFYKKTKVYALTEEQFELMKKTDMLPKNMLDNKDKTELAVRSLRYEDWVFSVYSEDDCEKTLECWTALPVINYKKIAELEDE